MRVLVVYYSRTGMTKKVALALAEKVGVDAEEIIDLKNRQGALGWIIAGKDAGQKNLTEIKSVQNNPADYDLVIVGTPVWVGTMTPAIRTYLTHYKDKIKRLACFSTQGGAARQKVFADIEALTGKKIEQELYLTTKEAAQDKFHVKLEEFVGKLHK